MKSKKQKVLIGVAIAVVVLAVAGVVLAFVLGTQKDDSESGLVIEDDKDAYGYVDQRNVAGLVTKFNQAVVQNESGLIEADLAAMVTHDDMYWYPLDGDLALVVVPVTFTDDVSKDVVSAMLIFVGSDEEQAGTESGDQTEVVQNEALTYLRCLVRANSEDLEADEIDSLITEAKDLRERGEMANHGGGIFVAISESGDHYEYQVVRNYRDEE